MTPEEKMEEEIERLSRALCAAFEVKPGDIVRETEEPKFRAYAGDTYMNWARDQVEIFMAIFSANLSK